MFCLVFLMWLLRREVMTWERFLHYWSFVRAIGRFPSQSSINAKLWCFCYQPEQTVHKQSSCQWFQSLHLTPLYWVPSPGSLGFPSVSLYDYLYVFVFNFCSDLRFYYGQNLAGNPADWTKSINDWIKEVKDFTFGAKNDGMKVGHYTQVNKGTSQSC